MAIDNVDFMGTNALMIELITLSFTPACVGSIYNYVYVYSSIETRSKFTTGTH